MPLLTEITVNRLLGKHYNFGFAIVSASRFKNTAQENNQLTKELFLKLKNSNYSYIPVFGGFIENKGEGVHHLAFCVDNISESLGEVESKGVRLIDKEPRQGAEGLQIAFLHPKSTQGVLTELCMNPKDKE